MLLLKPALVIGIAALIAVACRHRTAATRHAIWAAAILTTLAIPILSVALPALRMSVPVTPAAWPAVTSTPTRDVTLRAPRATSPKHVQAPARIDWNPLFVLWIAGVILFGARRAVAELRLRGIVRRSRPLKRRWRTELRVSEEISSPAVAGAFRPVVLLPTAAETWPEADFKAVLMHELAHVARRDCLLNLSGDVAKAVYWCNPFVHLAVRRMRAESEMACDDRVLREGAEPTRYAHLLLGMARSGGLPDAATAMARPRELESRLLAVLDDRMPRAPLPRRTSVMLAGLGLLLALPTAALTLQAAVALEPDRLGDSIASPSSERLPLPRDAYQVTPAVTQALAGPDSAFVRLLVAALDHRPDGEADLVRERAAWALSQARGGRLVEPLLSALESRDWRVQSYAAWALASAHDPRAVPLLIPLLGARVWRLRAMAASALRHSGDPRAEAAMHGALSDPAWQVRLEAVEYFGALGGPLRDARLRPRLDDRHVAVRLAAQQALTSH